MSDQFEGRLQEYFKKVDQERTEFSERVHKDQAKHQSFQDQFTQVTQTVIEPCLAKLRDVLLARNCPAAVVSTPPPGAMAMNGGGLGYIGLHCSNDRNHMASVERDPMFRIAFAANRGKVQIFATYLKLQGAPQPYNKLVPLNYVTEENLESMLLDFVAACFPR